MHTKKHYNIGSDAELNDLFSSRISIGDAITISHTSCGISDEEIVEIKRGKHGQQDIVILGNGNYIQREPNGRVTIFKNGTRHPIYTHYTNPTSQ